ncbi:hypothetical protein [Methylocella sp.]|uniref:hypothetical protein n=1 Tax=Methylocella sp. TaxID=1978226 RepID=UPI0037838D60
MFLAAGPVAAVFGALAYAKLDALLVAPALSPELVRLIEAHRVARGAIFARLLAATEEDL